MAGLIDEIKIVKIINENLGVDSREDVTSGQVVKALIINALGMVSRPLYLFPQFFKAHFETIIHPVVYRKRDVNFLCSSKPEQALI